MFASGAHSDFSKVASLLSAADLERHSHESSIKSRAFARKLAQVELDEAFQPIRAIVSSFDQFVKDWSPHLAAARQFHASHPANKLWFNPDSRADAWDDRF